jgi:hypothetical protein
MSGGHFDYIQFRFEDIAREIEAVIADNDNTEKTEYGDDVGRHYPPDVIRKFKETVDCVRRTAAMVQRVDWLLSDDDGPDSFMERWEEEVPKCRRGK